MHERSIFMEALDLSDQEDQEAHLLRACGDDERLRARVEALLRSHKAAKGFVLDRVPDVDVSATLDIAPPLEEPGTVIGPYKLLEQIGEGGMGAVYMAEQANRHSDSRKLGHAVRGELDWIVMKALEKDRRRRYETANDFAADVMRRLTDRPVEAWPPSARNRLAKYVRRHRAALTTVLLLTAALVVGTAVSAWQAVRATAAQSRAEEALRVKVNALNQTGDRTEAERVIARLENLGDARGVSRRLADIAWHLVQSDAPRANPPAYAVELAGRALTRQPDSVLASHVLGMAHYRAGDWDAAIEALGRANALEHDKGFAFNGFFVAMAYHRKGDHKQARSWYGRSVAWMAENKPNDPDASRYRDEAAALLGLDPPRGEAILKPAPESKIPGR